MSRRQVSPTATGRWHPFFFFEAASEALAIQETTGPGMLPSAMIRTTGVKGAHHLVSVTRKKASLNVQGGPFRLSKLGMALPFWLPFRSEWPLWEVRVLEFSMPEPELEPVCWLELPFLGI